jgi:hypothetical protein
MTVSTFYYTGPLAAPTQAQLNTLLTNISAAVLPSYKACLSADWTVTKETLDVVHVNNIQGVTTTTHAGQAGGRPAGHMPTEVAIVMLRKSGTKGQHGRGRLSLPAVSTADVASSSLTGAAITTALNALVTAMLATASDGTNPWTQAIAQRAGVSPKLVVGVATVLTVAYNSLLGTIRRRKVGRGK